MKRHTTLLILFLLCSSTHSIPYSVVCVGSPALDVLLQVKETTLQQVAPETGGSRPVDLLTFTNIIRHSGTKPKMSLGGSALNVARALAKLGQDCAFVGKVGEGEADTIFRDLARDNVEARLLKTATPTARVCCLITPDGQRTMRVFLGASTEELDINDIRFDCFENTQLVHIEGYLLYIKDGAFVRSIIAKAHACGARVSFDCGSYEVMSRYKSVIGDLLHNRQINILFCNEDEAHMLTGFNPAHSCRELRNFCDTIVVTAGKNGCWVADKHEVIHSPAIDARVIDTTGAGDFFEAGFLHGYACEKDLATCAQYGITMGTAAVEVLGTSLSRSHWKNIKNELSAH